MRPEIIKEMMDIIKKGPINTMELFKALDPESYNSEFYTVRRRGEARTIRRTQWLKNNDYIVKIRIDPVTKSAIWMAVA